MDNQNVNPTGQYATLPKLSHYAFVYGPLLGIFWALVFTVQAASSMYESPFLVSLINWVGTFGIIFYALYDHKRKAPEGVFISYGRALLVGVVVTLVGALIAAIASYIELKFVFPGYIEGLINFSIEKASAMVGDADALEQSLSMMERFMSPVFLTFSSLFGYFFSGFFFSLIAAIFNYTRIKG